MELILISVVSLLTFYKTINFYFWFDDFTMFYAAKLHECPFDWPFNSYCGFMTLIYNLIGDSPKPYFILAILLRILMGYSFYLFLKSRLSQKVALLGSLILVSLAGFDSMMTFYSISASIALFLLFVSVKAFPQNKLLSLSSFIFSTLLFPIYSTGHLFPILFSIKKNKIYATIFILVTLGTYVLIPYLQTGKTLLILERTNTAKLPQNFIGKKVSNYFYTTSHFILPEYIEWRYLTKVNSSTIKNTRVLIGILFHIFFVGLIFLNRKIKRIISWGLISFIVLITQYIPRGLVTSDGFGTHDRHMLYPYVGFVMVLGLISFVNRKTFYIVGSIILFTNIYQSNLFLGKYVDINIKRSEFHNSLKNIFLKTDIKNKSVIFIDSPQGNESFRLGDFVRSGTLPSESSIAFSLGINYRKFKLITESDKLKRMILGDEIKPSNFYALYFTGDSLIDRTFKARNNLFGTLVPKVLKINKNTKTDIFFDDKELIWKGITPDIEFEIDDIFGGVPFNLIMQIKTNFIDYQLPYSQCIKTGCSKSVGSIQELSSFIYESNLIKKDANVEVSNLDETTFAGNLLDGIYYNRWNANRSKWFQGEKPIITIKFSKDQALSGFFLTTSTSSRKPTQIEVYADNELLNCKFNEIGNDLIELMCDSGMYKNIKFKINKTTVEVPSIDEIDFIPTGYQNINYNDVQKFKIDPFAHVISTDEKNNLNNFGLRAGSDICLELDRGNGNIQRVFFPVFFDGLWHKYKISMPSVGIDNNKFHLGCINYPSEVNLQDVSVSFGQ